MTPVILLSEGFLGNGSEPWLIPRMADYPEIKPPFATKLSEDGTFHPFERDPETLVRKWAIPGQKNFEHRVGGLEKNHTGMLSSDPANHQRMVDERAAKVQKIADFIPELQIDGPEKGKLLVVGWGGTYGHILSAVSQVREAGKTLSRAHFDYIMPVPRNTKKVLEGFETVLVCELNSGQFAGYLRTLFPKVNIVSFGKVQGQPFLVNELVDAINKEI
jgi:2-oxoglutarate ferredoxin oxidoreductase subunit alpha